MSALTRFIAHKYLQNAEQSGSSSPSQSNQVEPMYAFDIHCNGFFPVILFFYFGNVSLTLISPLSLLCNIDEANFEFSLLL